MPALSRDMDHWCPDAALFAVLFVLGLTLARLSYPDAHRDSLTPKG